MADGRETAKNNPPEITLTPRGLEGPCACKVLKRKKPVNLKSCIQQSCHSEMKATLNIIGGNLKIGAAALENSLTVPQKVKHRVTHISTPRSVSKRNEDTGPHKNMFMNAHSSIIKTSRKCKKLKCP